MANSIDYQKSKPHFHVLDGLRGMAAIVILVFHFLEMIYPGDYVNNPLGHGFLAVDFFFCLSGFVVAYAYDERIKKIGVKGFFINRLIRLHPMVVFGTIIGLIYYLFDPSLQDLSEIGWDKLSLATLASLILIPFVMLPGRFGCIFPYNGTAWSLFSEYFISIVYALILVRLRKKMILAILVLGAIWVFYTAHKFTWLSVGWDFNSMSGGFVRVIYSFTAGLVIFRFNWILKNKGGLLFSFLLMMGVFVFPHQANDWIRESLLVVIVVPVVVALGAGATVGKRVGRFCKIVGDLSYPLYMTHISAIFYYMYYLQTHPDLSVQGKYFVAFLLFVFSILVSYASMKYFDEPVRKWLTRVKLSKISKKNNTSVQLGLTKS